MSDARASSRGRPRAVRFEQAVYGSFPFRDQGYAVLARSSGCRPEWVADFRAACQNLGERPAGAAEAPGLFALRLASGPWAVVGVSPLGRDDRGRPGALAFHALFLTPREYRKAGCDPFALAGALRSDWPADTPEVLPTGAWAVGPPADDDPADDPRAAPVVRALASGRRVALEAAGPIDGLARQVWRALPSTVRARASVATWAFGNGNRFDLLAVPRLAGVALDPSYVDPAGAGAGGGEPPAPASWFRRRRRLVLASGAVLMLGIGIGLGLRGGSSSTPERSAPVPSEAPTPPSPVAGQPRHPGPEPGDDADPGDPRRVAEALAALADRFGVEVGGDPAPDPATLMERVARDLRYRGPLLSDREIDQLRQSLRSGPDAPLVREAGMVFRWDAHVRRFADDRPLPEGFRRGPLRWQLRVLAWSFRCEGVAPWVTRRPPAEVPHALAESLAVDFPLSPTPILARRFPALASYRTFLDRLPRR